MVECSVCHSESPLRHGTPRGWCFMNGKGYVCLGCRLRIIEKKLFALSQESEVKDEL